MDYNKARFNEYGEIVEGKDLAVSTPKATSPSPVKKRCHMCGKELDLTHFVCTSCNDDKRYCSDACFQRHLRDKHYEEEYCAECGGKLGRSYTYSKKLNSKTGKKLRFCSDSCFDSFWDKNICAQCGSHLASQYWHSDKVDRAMREKLRFCSSRCADRYLLHNVCAQCGGKLGSRYTYCHDCGDSKYRFCGIVCYYAHRWAHH